jgi:hypothetical protein
MGRIAAGTAFVTRLAWPVCASIPKAAIQAIQDGNVKIATSRQQQSRLLTFRAPNKGWNKGRT